MSYAFWQRRFAGDAEIIDRTLTVNGNNFTIAGVMPAGFAIGKEVMPAVNAIERADLFLPLPISETARANRGNEDFNIFGKLKSGVSVHQAQAEMDVIAGRMKEQYPGNYPPEGGLTISVVPLLAQVVGDIGPALPVLFGAVGFVLLIACANVANLLLARAAVRRKEIAIRTAVGANRVRLLRQLLTESVLLAVMGGLAGLAVAVVAVKALRAFGPANIPRLDELGGIDGSVVAFTFFVSLLTGVVFGLAPALRASRVDLHETLKEGGRSSSGGGGRGALQPRKLLVISEVALSLVLLIGAGLLIRSYQRILGSNQGFNPHNVLAMRLSLPAKQYPTPDSITSFHKRASDKIAALPGVESVAATYSLPMSTVAFAWEPIVIEGYVPRTAHDSIISNVRIVSPDYFRTMGVPLVQGRLFNEHDRKGEMETVIVDEALAERFWPNENPLGKRISAAARIGKGTADRGLLSIRAGCRAKHVPGDSHDYRSGSDDLGDHAGDTIGRFGTSDARRQFDGRTAAHDSLARRRFSMILLSVFAAFALILAAIGIYGVMAYSVNQRTHEIGIRMALGAQRNDILQLVIRQAVILVSFGLAVGLVGAFALTRVMSSLLYGVSVTDRLTFVIVSLVLVGTALLASYVPARRATKVDPMVALRCE